jgi:hypothetical protein
MYTPHPLKKGASGIYDHTFDHYISIKVSSNKVDIKVNGLVEEMNPEIIDYNSAWITDYLSKDDSTGYNAGNYVIDEFTKSFGLEIATPIVPVKTEGDEDQAYKFYHLSKSGDLLLYRDNCNEDESIRPFFVQFHPVKKVDSKRRNDPWNGFHFYARNIGSHDKTCFAVIPVPDYPIKFIQSGQLGKEKELIWQYRIVLQ